MHKLFNNPIFRIIGITLILYYGLFSNKSHPDSLGNRLAPDQVKEDLKEVSSQSVNMMVNLQKAEAIKNAAPRKIPNPTKKDLPEKDLPEKKNQDEKNKDLNNTDNGK